MRFSKNILMMLILLATAAACTKSNRNSSGRETPGALGPANTTGSCATPQQALGWVYENNAAGTAVPFEQRVKALIAATVDPKYFGTISGQPTGGQNGVTMEGRLRYDAQGTVLLDQTYLKLTIYDSYVGQKDSSGTPVQPYPINFNTAAAGQVNPTTKQFTVRFKDNYGEVTLTGALNNSTAVGTLSYQNYTNFDGSPGASGVLGGFNIPACAWFN